jgi:hypothetical protein
MDTDQLIEAFTLALDGLVAYFEHLEKLMAEAETACLTAGDEKYLFYTGARSTYEEAARLTRQIRDQVVPLPEQGVRHD